jgi:hypothetical protein
MIRDGKVTESLIFNKDEIDVGVIKRLSGEHERGASFPLKEAVPKKNFRRFGEPETLTEASRLACHGAALPCIAASAGR